MGDIEIGAIIQVNVPLGVAWPWDRTIKMVVSSNSPHQYSYVVESYEDWIRATPVQLDLPNRSEVDVQILWVENWESVIG